MFLCAAVALSALLPLTPTQAREGSRSAWQLQPGQSVARLDRQAMLASLAAAPRHADQQPPPSIDQWAVIQLPDPQGVLERFIVHESALLPAELQAKFPEIRAYLGHGLDDPSKRVQAELTPAGFHAQVLVLGGVGGSESDSWVIDPVAGDEGTIDGDLHTVRTRTDAGIARADWRCHVQGLGIQPIDLNQDSGVEDEPAMIRVYRAAIACTGEFAQYHGGTKSAALGAIVTIINRVNGLLMLDVGVQLQLVANNDAIVYTNPNTDPFANGSTTGMATQNQLACDQLIGDPNYDFGHVLGTQGGGYGQLAGVCQWQKKAIGASGFWPPVGDPFAVDYVVHEIGHQLGANHTFNGVGGSCANNTVKPVAVEPGSGSTIMAYAGLCGPFDNLQPNSDPVFHAASMQEIAATIQSSGQCGWTYNTGNGRPVISGVSSGLTVPRGTPFRLKAEGWDPEGHAIVWGFDQLDVGPAQPASGAGSGDNGQSPLFRSTVPAWTSWREFPSPAVYLWNGSVIGEQWPQTSRTLNFRVIARDQAGWYSGISTANASVNVTTQSGPFSVYEPWWGMQTKGGVTVKWNPANTQNWPVYCNHVTIRLSTNNGASYDTTIAEWVPNSGSFNAWLPSLWTDQARIKVEASNNIFFAVSPPFTIQPGGSGGPCLADCDFSGQLTIDDHICFQTSFVLGSMAADCDGNAWLNIDDFVCFSTLFTIGC
jgi:Metallo-peptidase family M12B Reprolysin-like